MEISERDLCVVLLASALADPEGEQSRPLTARPFHLLMAELKNAGIMPEDLLSGSEEENLVRDLNLSADAQGRIRLLSARKDSAVKALGNLEERGIHVMTVFDPEYPRMLRRKLRETQLPPLFFYAGDPKLAGMAGIAVTGLRQPDAAGRDFTEKLAEKAAEEGLAIYSGGARGTDQIAEKTAAGKGGVYVSYLAEPLSIQIRKQELRQDAEAGRGLFLSDAAPDTPFTAGRALGRNKYIYASGIAAFAVEASLGKGGTFNGALYSIAHRLTKTFIWDNKDFPGNQELIRRGGIPCGFPDERPLADLCGRPKQQGGKKEAEPADWENPPEESAADEAGWHQMSLKDLGMI